MAITRRKRLTEDQRAAIIAKLKAEIPAVRIASEMGVSPSTVRFIKRTIAPERAATTSGGVTVGARLTLEEARAFDAFLGAKGFRSRSDALRSFIRSATGFIEMNAADESALDDVRRQLAKIGVNVNQIAFAANRGRIELVRAEWHTLNDLKALLPEVRWTVQKLASEQRRRGQGFAATIAPKDQSNG